MTKAIYILSIIWICIINPVQLFAEQDIAYETVYYTLDDALDVIFPEATSITQDKIYIDDNTKNAIEERVGLKISNQELTVYKGINNESSLGYALILDEQGKYQPITIMTAITEDFKIKDIILMVYREKIGASVRKKRFLRQFINKTSKHKLKIDQDIAGVSGATISSYSMANAVKKSLVITEELFKNK